MSDDWQVVEKALPDWHGSPHPSHAVLARLREREAQKDTILLRHQTCEGDKLRLEARVAELEEALRELVEEMEAGHHPELGIARRALAHKEETPK